MKKIGLAMAVMAVALPVLAQDTAPQAGYAAPAKSAITHNRKGIVAGLGVGGGERFLYYSALTRQNFVPMFDLKLGYGVTDRILILFNPSLVYARNDGLSVYTFNFPVAGQFYVFRDLYLRPGVGVSYSTRTYDAFLRAQNIMGKVTVGADMAVGYEFRLLGGRLGLSPEVVYHYARLPSGFTVTQSNTIGLQVSLLSFFKIR